MTQSQYKKRVEYFNTQEEATKFVSELNFRTVHIKAVYVKFLQDLNKWEVQVIYVFIPVR